MAMSGRVRVTGVVVLGYASLAMLAGCGSAGATSHSPTSESAAVSPATAIVSTSCYFGLSFGGGEVGSRPRRRSRRRTQAPASHAGVPRVSSQSSSTRERSTDSASPAAP